jgi:hypothetical protein
VLVASGLAAFLQPQLSISFSIIAILSDCACTEKQDAVNKSADSNIFFIGL